LNKFSGKKKFVLAGSGHIAGIINPATSVKYGHWINDDTPDDLEAWAENATFHDGSWWLNWAKWLGGQSGKLVKAGAPGDNQEYPILEPAPGSYVKS
jgi:polyhydroxyalkanoate synthase